MSGGIKGGFYGDDDERLLSCGSGIILVSGAPFRSARFAREIRPGHR